MKLTILKSEAYTKLGDSMKKLMLILSVVVLALQPHHIHAMDEWTLVCGSLVLTGGALAISAFANYQQAQRINGLETKLTKKRALITTLTQERDGLKKQLDERPATLWDLVVKKFHTFIPFMCVKENVAPIEELALIGTLGFERSKKIHKIAGLVTFISTNANFTQEEKNLVSDEEDALQDKEQVLDDIDAILTSVHQKIDGAQ